jgi:heme/copper-type cytochrome/quinol oxidase subunit 2
MKKKQSNIIFLFQLADFNAWYFYAFFSFVLGIIKFFHKYENISELDSAVMWQFGLQDPATPIMEGIVFFHSALMSILIIIGVFVFFLLYCSYSFYRHKYTKKFDKHCLHFIHYKPFFTHSTSLEIVWTTVPALILLYLASPSFVLLYATDEGSKVGQVWHPRLSFKAIGQQWFWGYNTFL